MMYYAVKNIVYSESGEVMMIITNVGFRKWVAHEHASLIAQTMSEYDEEGDESTSRENFVPINSPLLRKARK